MAWVRIPVLLLAASVASGPAASDPLEAEPASQASTQPVPQVQPSAAFLTWSNLCLGLAVAAAIGVCASLVVHGKRGWGWVVVGSLLVIVVFGLKTIGKILNRLPSRRRTWLDLWDSEE